MPAKSATSRKWTAGAVRAGRAAAVLTLATGVNGTLAAMFPHYEPIYVYLIAVTAVAWLSSALLGVTSAVVAVILYDWMFSPVRVVPSMSFLIPLTIAVATAMATRAIRGPLTQPALPKPTTLPLLPAIDHPTAVDTAVIQDNRVPKLEAELAEARSSAQAREAAFAKEMEALQERLAEQGKLSIAARRDFDALLRRVSDADARVAALQQSLEVAQRRGDEEQMRADREAKLREQLETAGHESLQKAISDLSTKHEARLLETRQRLELATTAAQKSQRIVAEMTAKHETAVGEARKRADAAVAKVDALQRELDRTLASLSDEHARADREAKLRTQLETAARATLHRTADVSATHQREATVAREAARVAEERIVALVHELEEVRSAAEEQRRQAEETLQPHLSGVEEARDSFVKELESVKADRERLAAELETARKDADVERQHARELGEKARPIAAENENAEARDSLQKELESAKAEREKIAAELENAHKGIEIERQHARELGEKARHIAIEHENAMGESLLTRETAKAEMRTMTQKLHELQRAVEQERRRTAEEKAARERLDAEWGEKLQKIVAHLAEDHEADIGEALMAKEAARAEVRTFAARVTALQQRMEEEREKFRKTAERWQQERASLVAQVEAAELKVRRPAYPPTIEQPMPVTTKTDRTHIVLVVHSDSGVRAMTKHSLQQFGYSVLTAADGLEGLRMATQQKPDVVIAEAVMPKMNARELVQLLKSRRETKDVKIVLVSGSGQTERGADFRADDVVRSPIDFNDLRTVLANVLTRRGVAS